MPDVTIGDTEIATLQRDAASGNEVARNVLEELGHPVTTEKDDKGADPNNTQETRQTGDETEPGKQVEAPQKGGEPGQRKPPAETKETVYDTIRDLRASRRELKDENNVLRQQVTQLTEKLSEVVDRLKSGKAATSGTEEDDDPSQILVDPKGYMAKMREQMRQELRKEVVATMTTHLKKRTEGSEALSIVKTMPNYDHKRDEAELLDLIEEEGIDDYIKVSPMKAAKLIARLWSERHKLAPEVEKRKNAAASTGSTGGGKVPQSKPTLESINAAAKNAGRDPAKLNAIWADLEKAVG